VFSPWGPSQSASRSSGPGSEGHLEPAGAADVGVGVLPLVVLRGGGVEAGHPNPEVSKVEGRLSDPAREHLVWTELVEMPGGHR
jgi:hypothetical protein